MKLWPVLAGAALAASSVRHLRRMAEEQGRPLSEFVGDLPHRLREDAATLPDDLRAALVDARDAARRGEDDLDRRVRETLAGGSGDS